MDFSSLFIGIMFTLFIYHFVIFLGRKNDKSNLWYSLLCLFLGVSHLIATYNRFTPGSGTQILTLLTMWSLIFISICVNLFAFSIFDLKRFRIISRLHYLITPASGGLFSLVYALTNNNTFVAISYSIIALGPILLTYLIVRYVVIQKNIRNKSEKIILSVFLVFIVSGILILVSNSTIPTSFGCIMTTILAFGFSFALAHHFNTEHKDLFNLKSNLEKEIEKRTKELVIANEELKTLDKSKDLLLANISHELRTPLTLIRTPVDAIIKGKFGTKIDRSDRLFEIILGNSNKLINHINNLLNFSKIGIISLQKKPVDVVRIIKMYMAELDSAFQSKKIELEFETTVDPIILNVDQQLFESVISNLLSNAYKFTPQKGRVHIGSKLKENEWVLTVSDNGTGIPASEQPHIFNRFYQARQSSTNKNEGTGIGLALVKEIVQRHDGKISVSSEEHKGSIFTVSLPAQGCNNEILPEVPCALLTEAKNSIPQEEIEDQISIDYSVSKKHIFIVEDSLQMQTLLISLLKDKYNISCANHGRDALEKLERLVKPNLIISDIMMPQMDGIDFHQSLRENKQFKNIPFLFLTARATQEEKEYSLKQGAFDYLYKPFSVNELESKIENLLEWDRILKNYIRDRMIEKISDITSEDDPSYASVVFPRKQICKKHQISPREEEIIEHIIKGLQDKEISNKLSISRSTVSNHIHNIYNKLKINSRTELIGKFIKL